MKTINNYIVEKLRINKDTNINTINTDTSIFVIIYSKNNKTEYKLFWKYEDAIKFTKKEYFLDGYFCPIKYLDILITKLISPPKPIPDKYFEEVREWAKENDIIYIFDYKK